MDVTNVLVYDKPAQSWELGMPIGNGWLGGMVIGDYTNEHIYLNLDTLWTGDGRDKNLINNTHHLSRVRQLIKDGKGVEADAYAMENLLSEFTETYMPAGDLHIDFHCAGDVKKGYKRSLQLNEGVVNIEQDILKRQIFCSNKDHVMSVHLKGEEIQCDLSLSSQLKHDLELNSKGIVLVGEAPIWVEKRSSKNPQIIQYREDRQGMKFILALSIETDGLCTLKGNKLIIQSASYLNIYLTGDTTFSQQTVEKCIAVSNERLRNVLKKQYEDIYKRHVKDYKELYDRVEFKLGKKEVMDRYSYTTNQLIDCFTESGEGIELIPLVFNFGRYLIISASRENSKAMHLQGIWSDDTQPIWQSNHTLNINTEMNYWPVEMCNLSECHLPLFHLLKKLSEKGQKTAKEHYGCKGWVAHHNTDIWAHTSPVGLNNPSKLVQAALWPMSSGWLCIHLWEHYLYTSDEEFLLEEALPIMLSATKFYMDWLIEDEKQMLVTIPSTTPENQYNKDGSNLSMSVSTTMDIAILRKLFQSTIEACKLLNVEEETVLELKDILLRMRRYKVGKRGRLMEWSEDFEDMDPVHRHVSHLFPLYPGNDITPDRTPDLADACIKTLNERGDDGTGWSIAWKALFWARLKDGEHALKLLNRYLRPMDDTEVNYYNGGIYYSLLCAHPPFQIDGNCGITAAIGEMLIQSHEGYIELLPALPKAWDEGKLSGIKARGNYIVDFSWSNNKVISLQVHSPKKYCQVKVNGEIKVYKCNKLIEL